MKRLLIFTVLFIPVALFAELYYTPSEYRKLYNENYLNELELKHLKQKTREERDRLNSKIANLRLEVSNLEKELKRLELEKSEEKINHKLAEAKLKGRIRNLEDKVDSLTEEKERENRLHNLQVEKLKKEIEILQKQSSEREQELLKNNEELEKKYLKEIEEQKNISSKKITALQDELRTTKESCDKREQELKRTIEELRNKLNELADIAEKRKLELEKIEARAKEIESRLSKEIEEGRLKLKRLKNKIVINMDNKILFPSGSADLKPEVAAMLRKISEVLERQQKDARIQVEGHTDNVPIRTVRYHDNWDLSAARALSVLKELLDNPNLDPSRFSAAGYGQFQPIAPNDTPEGRALNRRVDIVLIPDQP